jgi:hypothetical protein
VKVKIKSVPEIRLRSILVCKRFDYFAVSRTKQEVIFIFHPILHSVQSCRSIVGSVFDDVDDDDDLIKVFSDFLRTALPETLLLSKRRRF